MGIYKNSYTENEDRILWALHEIRHELHEERKNKTIDEINREALRIYSGWRNERDSKIAVTGNFAAHNDKLCERYSIQTA